MTARGLTGVIYVAADQPTTLALRSDGTVWAWGLNASGIIGDGTTTPKTTPTQVPGLSEVTAIALRFQIAYALRSDGTVWVWGRGWERQFGDGSSGNRATPAPVPKLSHVSAIVPGSLWVHALHSDGTVWAWGQNNECQLGDGTTIERRFPVRVAGLTGIVAITSDNGVTGHAVRSDGIVWAWGQNSDNGGNRVRGEVRRHCAGLGPELSRLVGQRQRGHRADRPDASGGLDRCVRYSRLG